MLNSMPKCISPEGQPRVRLEASGRWHEEEVQCWVPHLIVQHLEHLWDERASGGRDFPLQRGSLFLPSLPHQHQGLSCLKEQPRLEQKGIRGTSTFRVEREKAGFRVHRENYVLKLKTFLGSFSAPDFTSQGSSCLSQSVCLSSPRAVKWMSSTKGEWGTTTMGNTPQGKAPRCSAADTISICLTVLTPVQTNGPVWSTGWHCRPS